MCEIMSSADYQLINGPTKFCFHCGNYRPIEDFMKKREHKMCSACRTKVRNYIGRKTEDENKNKIKKECECGSFISEAKMNHHLKGKEHRIKMFNLKNTIN